jgi:hypothetical protein
VIEAGSRRDDDPNVKYAAGYLAISTSAVSVLFYFISLLLTNI